MNTRFSRFHRERDISSVTDQRTNGPTDRWTKPLIELRVRNQKQIKKYTLSFFSHTFFTFILKQFGH